MFEFPSSHFVNRFPASQPIAARCLTPDTTFGVSAEAIVLTARGPRRADDIRVGDGIVAMDGSVVQVLWKGTGLGTGLCAHTSSGQLLLGNRQDMVVTDVRVLSPFGLTSAIVAADQLNDTGVELCERLVEFMFSAPHAFRANGVWVTSFVPDDQGLARLPQDERDRLFRAAPRLRHAVARAGMQPIAPRVTRSDIERALGAVDFNARATGLAG